METVWKNVTYSVRMLLKRPSLTVVAIIAMALGIGANTAIFSVVNTVLLRPLPYQQPEQLVTLATEQRDQFSTVAVLSPFPICWICKRVRRRSKQSLRTNALERW